MALSASDLPAMYSLLVNSMSGDESLRKPAEAALSESESRPGFCSCLMEVITAKDLVSQVDIRLMASVYFKNSVNRYWRNKRDSSGISNEEKIHLRQKLLSHLREENYQIALMLAVLISKIARIDYPKEWPELFSVLAQQLQSADVLTSHRIFMIIFRTLKELSTKRLTSDQKTFAQEVQPVKDVSPVLLNAIQSFLPYYSSFQKVYPKFWDFTGRACTKLMKVLVAIQGRHPFTFGDKCVLLPVMEFCLNKITEPEPDLLSFEQFLIQCMVMVKCVLECKEYKRSLTGRVMDENRITQEQIKKNISSSVGGVLTSLLPNDRIILLCNVLIRRYFVLTPSDLEELYQNPESFHHEQDMVQWTEKLRPCAEALYIVLFENHSQLLGPVVVSLLQEAMKGCATSVTELTPGLLLKDAAYGAAAYVYYELSNYLSFKDWYNGALSQELSNDHPNMCIIHRKVALILGQWVSEIKDDTQRPVYCDLIKLLQDKNLSVRLAACRSLCLHVEDANFSEREFRDLLPICWGSCFKLVEEVQEFDSKVQVLYLISVLIAHVSEVIPFADNLVQFFQKVWEESSGESLLLIQLLIALRNFVVALGCQSPLCYTLLLPILQKGMDVNGPDELLEDSLLLWEAALSYAPSLVPQLVAYFPSLVDIMERSFDHLQVSVTIIEDYIILGGADFLQMHASSVARILDLIVGNVNDKGILSTLPVIDTLVQCFPAEVPPLICSTLQKLITICLSGGDDRDPSRTAVKATSAAILARILVMNTNYLAQLTSEQSTLSLLQKAGIPVKENILLSLVDVWLDKVDNVSSIQKKTFGLALSIILTLRLPQVLDMLDQILSVCTTVMLSGNEEVDEEESSGENLSCTKSHGEGSIPCIELRRRQIKFSDPINQMSLETSVRENLQTCAGLHGESFNTAIGNMHPAALEQLKQALKMQ
ncbi:Importin-11 [Morella rubra]|uniref:Importin-11 n=1 Tax=Morella rubra TaxID=262757 RepID=A0A6A1WGD4_9ROSI|nr:Importin-11 [Morella rubra]